MQNFRDYAKSHEKQQPLTKENDHATDQKSAEDLTRKIASAYHGKSNGDIWKSILIEAEKSRRAGTLSNADIDNFYATFSPMLDSSQRKKLQSVVQKLKEI